MDFLVQVGDEQAEEKGQMVPVRRWVLAVDELTNQLLITTGKGQLVWVSIDKCKFAGTPVGSPQPVFVLQPEEPDEPEKKSPDLVIVRGSGVPKLNGQ